MKNPWEYASGLLELPTLSDGTQAKAAWRQSLATLSRACVDDELSPLEGLNPAELAKGVKAALSAGLVDDLDWLAAPAAGMSLYALAAALPNGPEQREVGRRVLARFHAANAETFVAMATRIALTTGKGLSAPGIRSRVAMVFEAPIALALADGPLALALSSGRDLSREWVVVPSTGSLTTRRLTARLVERAAREAAKRAIQGDEHALRIFRAGAVRDALRLLLEDREGLVWRHAAIARGLVAPWVQDLDEDVKRSLAADLSPTEWRRGATSLAASVAVQRDLAIKTLTTAIERGAIGRDRGVATAIAWGAARGGEAEPELTSQLLVRIAKEAPVEAAEGLVDLLREFGRAPFAERAVDVARAQLAKLPASGDDGADSVAFLIGRDLDPARNLGGLYALEAEALSAFVTEGAVASRALAPKVLEAVSTSLASLDVLAPASTRAAEDGGAGARRTSLEHLRMLDAALLERTLVADIIRLGGDAKHEEELERAKDHLGGWLLQQEGGGAAGQHVTLPMRRLRTLLHLVDADLAGGEGARARAQAMWIRVVTLLLARLSSGTAGALRRTMFATLARALDALIRAEVVTVADIVLVLAHFFDDEVDFQTLAEASMDPELVHSLTKYGALAMHTQMSMRTGSLMSVSQSTVSQALASDSSSHASTAPKKREPTNPDIAALELLADELFLNTTSRAEMLRTAIVRVSASLRSIEQANSLKALAGENSPLAALEHALAAIAQMHAGARQKLLVHAEPTAPMPARGPNEGPELLSVLVSRLVANPRDRLSLDAVHRALAPLVADVPKLVRHTVFRVLARLESLPPETRGVQDGGQVETGNEQLPAWVPPRRTLGGFYILRSLGGGAAGTVLLSCRVEERHEPKAERFALKVPDYSATAARSLSEEEFLKLFRAEASALIDLPSHPNLAGFVTFDAGAKPKPILVMEMVEGVTLEHLIEARALDPARCVEVIDDLLAGLEAMHAAGVGHLDIKPSNIVLRGGKQGVLVDFGLAGKNVRPGCATGPYGAPEVWGAYEGTAPPSPQAADVYAAACVIFEVLSGQTLIEAPNELALVAAHIAHDGKPPRLLSFGGKGTMQGMKELLMSMLRRDPDRRPPIGVVRQAFVSLKREVERASWPIV